MLSIILRFIATTFRSWIRYSNRTRALAQNLLFYVAKANGHGYHLPLQPKGRGYFRQLTN